MKALNMKWCKKEWTHAENCRIVLNKDAPEEAKESYKQYLEQLKENPSAI